MHALPKKIRTGYLVNVGNMLALALFVSTCHVMREESEPLSGVVHYSGREFAGSASCAACHPAITETHLETPHFNTSARATHETIKGSFKPGENVLKVNTEAMVLLEERPPGFFQIAMVAGQPIAEKSMDITIGSGRKGQTYLYWDSNALFQLPASYYTPSDTWCNSPGYPGDQILFNRNIQARCLECHSTFFRLGRSVNGRESFRKDQVMLGVDCERCHGPAADHVRFHQRYPDETEPRNITNPAKLSRQQKLDNCALCHSGVRENLMPSFTFTVGDRLDDFFHASYSGDSASALDVHGNQYGLLTSSACFQKSEMDCSSCHDVHAKESGKLDLFSQRCMTCHSPKGADFCTQPPAPGLDLSKNCVDCHMPALPSAKVFLQAADSAGTTPFLVRTHHISTYKEQVRLLLANSSRTDSL